MRNGKKGILLAALFTTAVFLSGCGTPSVKVMPAEKKMVPFVYETETKIDALHAMEIIPRVSGQIVSDIPDIGTAVQAGQLLFQIDASPYEAQKADLMGRAAAAVPAAPAAPPVDDSMEASLLRQGIITRAEYNRLRARRGGNAVVPAAAPATDEAARIALQSVQQAISDCTVMAPISGVIAQNYISDTKEAAAGRTALVIRQDSPVIASIQIPAEMDAILDRAKTAKTLTVTIRGDNDFWYGELKPQPNPEGDAYTVYKVQADNPDNEMHIGETYTIRIDSGQSVEGYVIPASALIGDDRVEIVNEDNLIDIRTVTVATLSGEERLILDGLQEGDRIVLHPSEELQLGTEVRVQ